MADPRPALVPPEVTAVPSSRKRHLDKPAISLSPKYISAVNPKTKETVRLVETIGSTETPAMLATSDHRAKVEYWIEDSRVIQAYLESRYPTSSGASDSREVAYEDSLVEEAIAYAPLSKILARHGFGLATFDYSDDLDIIDVVYEIATSTADIPRLQILYQSRSGLR